ncbi:MAG: hypothetical protein ACRD4E_03175, partial [Bryobacteraceae bacterium]
FILILGRRARLVSNPWFRIIHLISVFFVLAEDIVGLNCPLNVAETSLRTTEYGRAEASLGIGYVLDQLLHHTISGRVLDDMYWTLGVASILLPFLVPPRFKRFRS